MLEGKGVEGVVDLSRAVKADKGARAGRRIEMAPEQELSPGSELHAVDGGALWAESADKGGVQFRSSGPSMNLG